MGGDSFVLQIVFQCYQACPINTSQNCSAGPGGWLGGCHPGGDGAETLCSPAFWQGLGLLSVGMCLSCHVGQKGGAAAAKVLLLSRMVKELSVWPGRHAVWPWAGTGCPALDFGESGPCRSCSMASVPSSLPAQSRECWSWCVWAGRGAWPWAPWLALPSMVSWWLQNYSPAHPAHTVGTSSPAPCASSQDHVSLPPCSVASHRHLALSWGVEQGLPPQHRAFGCQIKHPVGQRMLRWM